LTGLLAGLYAANRERVIAQQRFNEVRQLSNQLFDIDRQVLALPGSSKTRQMIVDTSLDYLRRLAADVRGDPELALDVGTAYMRVGRVQGVPISPNLGQSDNAEQNLQIAEKLIRSVLEKQPGNRTAYLRLSQIAHDRMLLALGRRPNTEALPLAQRSEKWLETYLSSGKVEEAEKNQVVIIGMNVANCYIRKDLADPGLRVLHRTIEIAKATNQPGQAGAAQIVMARSLRGNGDLDGALSVIREGVRLLEVPPAGQNRIMTAYGLALRTQGEILGEDNAISLGRSREAAEYLERSYRISLEAVRQDAIDSLSRIALFERGVKLAGILRHSDPRRAIEIYDEVLRHLAEVKNNSAARLGEAKTLARSTYALRQLGRTREAGERLDGALLRLKELQLYPAEQVEPGSEPDDVMRALADYESGSGRVQRGVEIYEELLAKIRASTSDTKTNLKAATDLSNIYAATAVLHRRAGQRDLASEVEARRLELWRHWERKLPNNSFVLRQIARIQKSEVPDQKSVPH
jgi:serine/threonine-protein kinase